jgi:hypothetical protein
MRSFLGDSREMDMMGFFTRRCSRPARRRLLTLEPLEDRTLLAGNLLITAEVPGRIQYNLMQYTQQGTQVSSQNIPQSPSATEYQDARGLTVDPSGNVHIADGTMSPFLDTATPTPVPQPAWSYQTTSGWAIGSNITYGEVASYKNFVFASNMQSQNGVFHGIIRFDTTGGSPVQFASGTQSLQITLGLDGNLYELVGNGNSPAPNPTINVFNPDTLALVRSFHLSTSFNSDIRSIAVDASGNVYAADWSDTLTKYDPTGTPLKTQTGYSENLMNVAIDTDGQIAVGGRNGGIYLTDESLNSLRSIQTGQWDVFVTFNHYIGVAPATATFVKTDTSTEGNWQGAYGSQGYNVIDNATSYPNYAQVRAAGNSNYVWSSSTTDPRALQDVGTSNRIAACWYAGASSGQGFTINANLTDGQTHQLALYLLDWDQWGGGRSEQVQLVDANSGIVLNTQNVSNFGNGEYLVWNVSGDIQIKITSTDSFGSAVLSGLFLDPVPSPPTPGTASFVKTDTTTEGNWNGAYGSQGYNIIGNASSYPSYAQVSSSGNSNYVWSSSTTDSRALQDAGSNNRIAACWYAGTSSGQGFTVNVNITDGQTHQLALYLLDWDQYGGGRSEQVQLVDATSGTVLNTQSVSNFGNGEYLVWNVSGDIQIRITSQDSFGSAVLSGLFLDPVPSPPTPGTASFVKTDTTTEGNWRGVYGSQGYNVIDNATSYPSYAQVSATGNSNFIWNSSTTDPRALQEVNSNNRIAACWYAGTSSGQGFTINANLTDGLTHQLALYLLDWDQYSGGRSEQVQILDATTGKVLDTQNVSSFGNGEYLVWNVSGDIQIRITSEDSFGSAVVSGLFFDA